MLARPVRDRARALRQATGLARFAREGRTMNVATMRRDLSIARNLESGLFNAWADGFGVWHARVPRTMGSPYSAARYTIRLMLQERAPRDTYVDPPSIRRDPANDTADGYAYVESDV